MTGLDQSQIASSDCGCCEGLAVETPVEISNRPGLSAIAYRIGTQAQFKASMVAGLTESGLLELRKLKTREDDDFTIALLDAWALVSDVLTFYQERIANESFLRTATERGSIVNLARLIGYRLRPGVAASTYLAFTMETGLGAPAKLTIEKGLRVQSIPGPNEKPQSFETIEQIEARPTWNVLKPRSTQLQYPSFGDTHMYLQGVTTNLKPGDPLLIVGAERLKKAGNENWEIRRVASVQPDVPHNRTLVRWNEPLGSRLPHVEPPKDTPKVYALRLRASLYGFNAPDWKALPVALRVGELNPNPVKNDGSDRVLKGAYADMEHSWADASLAKNTTSINLDAIYNSIVLHSWIVLAQPTYAELYHVRGVAEEVKSNFGITAKTTRLEITGENTEKFSPRNATVLAQSEELEIAEMPLEDPVWQKEIMLDQVVDGLEPGRKFVVAGKRMRALIGATRPKLELVSADASQRVPLASGDSLIVMAPAADIPNAPTQKLWHLIDKTGFEGYVSAPQDKITLAASAEDDATVNEVVELDEAVLSPDKDHTILKLAVALKNVFDRSTVTIFANVALSTHGETVKDEVLGIGDAGQPYQRFSLRQFPLTYTSADTPSGAESTLEVRVNDLKWTEVPALFGHGPRERIYVTQIGDDGKTTIEFGDGQTGARLPMGLENVKATYRKGIGLDGLLKAGQLSLLMTRPLGLKSAVNPLPADGAQNPEELSDARTNSPLTVLTLERIVSLRDYEDFARSFSGIAKALATWTWNGHTRGVFVTVAGINGAEVREDSVLLDKLISAMLKAGDSLVAVKVKSYRRLTFKLVANVKVDEQYIESKVLAAAESSLRSSFSFAARGFGQPVTLSEAIAVLKNVPGVVAVDINKLYRTDSKEAWNSFLRSQAPQAGDDANVDPAELLILDPTPLQLGVMP